MGLVVSCLKPLTVKYIYILYIYIYIYHSFNGIHGFSNSINIFNISDYKANECTEVQNPRYKDVTLNRIHLSINK